MHKTARQPHSDATRSKANEVYGGGYKHPMQEDRSLQTVVRMAVEGPQGLNCQRPSSAALESSHHKITKRKSKH